MGVKLLVVKEDLSTNVTLAVFDLRQFVSLAHVHTLLAGSGERRKRERALERERERALK